MNLTRFKSRVLSVSPSTNNIAKRQATTIINPATSRSSGSPTPDLHAPNGLEVASAGSPASESSTTQTHPPSIHDRQSRTIALLNVPDTVTSDRIRALAEPHGALVKVQLRPDHQGAILEYADAGSTGRAGLALDGHAIEPNRPLRVATVPEMLKERAEVKSTRIGDAKKKKEKDPRQQPAMIPIRRPTQPGARRGGGRGGLGVKRGGDTSRRPTTSDAAGKEKEVALNGSSEEGHEGEEGLGGSGKAKSNADFKAMFLKR